MSNIKTDSNGYKHVGNIKNVNFKNANKSAPPKQVNDVIPIKKKKEK